MLTTTTKRTASLIWIVAAGIVLLDQGSKALVLKHLADGHVQTVIPHLLDWVFVENARGAYGLFGDRPWFLIAISSIAFGAIWYWFRDLAARSSFVASSLGLVLGGAVGNIIDRLLHGFVVDFIRVIPLPIFEVFNVADSAISIGIVLIVIASLRNDTAAKQTALRDE